MWLIQIDRERLGQEAVRTLLALRDGEPDHDDIVVPVSLVVRESA
jgi:DNA-binding LacI/PurR family transcriptional regulator